MEIRTSSCYFQHAGVCDVAAAIEVECLEIRTSSCYFQHAGVCDVLAASEVECLEIRTSSCYFQHTGVCDVAAASRLSVWRFEHRLATSSTLASVMLLQLSEVECLEIRTSSCYFHHAGVGDVPAAIEVECLEFRTSSCYFQHTGVSDSACACSDRGRVFGDSNIVLLLPSHWHR